MRFVDVFYSYDLPSLMTFNSPFMRFTTVKRAIMYYSRAFQFSPHEIMRFRKLI